MEARAMARYVRVTPRKARRVVDLIRGLPADQAQAVLAFAPQSASDPVGKVLASAIANADAMGGRGDRGMLWVRNVREMFGPRTPLGKRRTQFADAPEHDLAAMEEALVEREPITVVVSDRPDTGGAPASSAASRGAASRGAANRRERTR